MGQERTTDTLPNAHEKGVALRESFQRNAMKKGGEHECAAAGFPFIGDIGGSGCDARLGTSGGAHGRHGGDHAGATRLSIGKLLTFRGNQRLFFLNCCAKGTPHIIKCM